MRIVIIGAGKMGREHLNVFQAIPACQVVGIVSKGGDSAAKLASEYSIPWHGTNWSEVADASGANACVVAVSHELTESISRDVISSGRHVLAEKPVALSSKAIEDLAMLAKKRDVIALAAVNRRYYPGITQSLDQIRLLGETYHISIIAPDSPAQRRFEGIHSPAVCDLWLKMNTIHAIDLLRCVGGEVVEVVGFKRTQTLIDQTTISAVLRFENGTLGIFVLPGGRNTPWELRVTSENCELIARPLEQARIKIGNEQPKNIPVTKSSKTAPFKMGLFEQANAFVDAVEFGVVAWPSSDFFDHAKTMSLIEQLQNLDEHPLAKHG